MQTCWHLVLTAGLSLSALMLTSVARAQDSDPAQTDASIVDEPPIEEQQRPVRDDAEDAPIPLEVVVVLQGGREVWGLFVEQNTDRVVIRIEGIETTFPASTVRSLRYLPPLLERYESMRKLVRDEDLEGRLILADWLRARELYDLALAEVQQVLAVDEFHPRARDMKAWLEQQIALVAQQLPQVGDGTPLRPADIVERRRKFPLLKPDEINLIKVYEVDLQRPPRMIIRRETIDRMIRSYPDSHLIPGTVEAREALYRKRPEEILEIMFRLQARELYGEVVVRDHPSAIQKFRTDVHARWLINSCATAQCHGGEEAGRLWLHDMRVNSDATLYTNLLILDRFKLENGTPLINYAEPARSPLLHMALPKEISLYPHPDAPRTRGSQGWRPVFRTSEDRGYQDAVAWISGMYRPRPEYPIEYEVPSPTPPPALETEGQSPTGR